MCMRCMASISCIYTASILHPLPQTDRQTEIMLPNSNTANFLTARLGAAQPRTSNVRKERQTAVPRSGPRRGARTAALCCVNILYMYSPGGAQK